MDLDNELREERERLLQQSPLQALLKAAWNAEDAAIKRMREKQPYWAALLALRPDRNQRL